MLRRAALVLASIAAATAAAAQAPAVDFLLRGTVAAEEGAPPEAGADPGETAGDMEAEGSEAGFDAGPADGGEAPAAPVGRAAGRAAEAAPGNARRPRREEEADPYAAAGIRLGSFVLRPSLEVGVAASDDAGGRGGRAAGLAWAPQAVLESDWSRHALKAEAAAEGIHYGTRSLDEASAAARLSGRLDLAAGMVLEAALGYRFGRDRYDDPDTPAAAAERPAVHRFEAELGGRRRFGRLELSLTGRAEQSRNAPLRLADGATQSRRSLDATLTEARLRGAYDLAAIDPFVEIAAGRRDHEAATDEAGYRRDSRWGELRGGLLFDLGPKLQGEAAAGLRRDVFADRRFADRDSLVASARLIWSPQRLTEVTLEARSEARPSTLAGVSGSLVYSGRLAVARQARRNLRLEAGIEAEHERFAGSGRSDVTLAGFAGFTYDLRRGAALIGRYRYERQDSSDPAADSEASTVSLRLRLER